MCAHVWGHMCAALCVHACEGYVPGHVPSRNSVVLIVLGNVDAVS